MQPILVIIISTIVFYVYFNISEILMNRKTRKLLDEKLSDLDDRFSDLNKFRDDVSPEFYEALSREILQEERLARSIYPKKRGFFK